LGGGNDPQIGTEVLRALLVKDPPVTPDPALDPYTALVPDAALDPVTALDP
jgi:hypothetical protein